MRYDLFFIFCCTVMAGCYSTTPEKKLAKYVGDPVNGLTRHATVDSNTITCQFIPAQSPDEEGRACRFRIYLNSSQPASNDSVMYFLNYRSAGLFGLVSEGDTLSPLLSERVANGRTDRHEFTVVFPALPAKSDGQFQIVIHKNVLINSDVNFVYKHRDINKASKNIYGYDQDQN